VGERQRERLLELTYERMDPKSGSDGTRTRDLRRDRPAF
jgi:hypothetical protein